MPKSVMPIFEPLPYYMSAIGMRGARFIEGVPEPVAPTPVVEPVVTPVAPEPKAPVDDFKSPESKDAVLADLQKERDQRKVFQGQVTERDTQLQTLTESLTEKATAITERDAQIVAKDSELAVLRLAMSSGLSEQSDIDLLAAVTDEAKRAALAERLSKAAGGNGVVSKSGTGSYTATAGSVSAGREEYRNRKK